MDWFNYIGLLFVAMIVPPEAIYKKKHPNEQKGVFVRKFVDKTASISRILCLICMVLYIPNEGFLFNQGKYVFLYVGLGLCFIYDLVYIILWKKNWRFKQLMFSVISSIIYIFSAVVLLHIPLMVCSSIYAISNIYIDSKIARFSR